MTKIKICGLKRIEDVQMVNRARPDFVGFVFAGTKRKISFEQAAQFRNMLRPEIKSVGVFVNEPSENVEKLCKDGIIDLIQLHGDEPEEEIRHLKQSTGKPVIRAVRVQTAEDIVRWADSAADYLLLDTYRAGEYGGSGESFSRSLIDEAREILAKQGKVLKDFFLAGGLAPDNVRAAIGQAGAFAVDVSSGVETDGFKDEEKIAAFLRAVRG